MFARLDRCDPRKPSCTAGDNGNAWRCYAADTLSEDRLRFVGGFSYCSQDAPLRKLLERCVAEMLGKGGKRHSTDNIRHSALIEDRSGRGDRAWLWATGLIFLWFGNALAL